MRELAMPTDGMAQEGAIAACDIDMLIGGGPQRPAYRDDRSD